MYRTHDGLMILSAFDSGVETDGSVKIVVEQDVVVMRVFTDEANGATFEEANNGTVLTIGITGVRVLLVY